MSTTKRDSEFRAALAALICAGALATSCPRTALAQPQGTAVTQPAPEAPAYEPPREAEQLEPSPDAPPRAYEELAHPVDPIASYARQISELVSDVYARSGKTRLWLGAEARLDENVTAALDTIAHADEQGLDGRAYRVAEIENAIERWRTDRVSDEDLQRLDELVTTSLVMYTHDVALGRLDPFHLGIVGGDALPPRIEVAGIVDALAHGAPAEQAFAGIAPRHPEYERLRTALARYRQIQSQRVWPPIPGGPLMKPGESHSRTRIEALARRLHAEDLLDASAVPKPSRGSTSATYSQSIASGVKRFQTFRGLAVDGVVGARTLAELNRTPAAIVRTIALNMERWRWLPDDLGASHVRVNVPAFELAAYDGDEEKLQMPIIVGQVTWGTPLFSNRLRSVILNPFWNVPQSIAKKEVLARVFADRSYLARESMEIVSGSGPSSRVVPPGDVNWKALKPATFPYRLRQRPGPLNPLGRIKFLFPNRFNVYIHDTPSGRLFALPDRALSHGCIRIAEPLELAQWLFRDDPRWGGSRIEEAIQAGGHDAIQITRPVAIHILYFTAVAREDGRLEVYRDLYGIDATLERSLRELADATAAMAETPATEGTDPPIVVPPTPASTP